MTIYCLQLLTCETGFMYAVPGTDWSSLRVTSTEAMPTAAASERGVGIQIREDYRRRCRIAIAAAVAAATAAAAAAAAVLLLLSHNRWF